jgi:hypothetical protein
MICGNCKTSIFQTSAICPVCGVKAGQGRVKTYVTAVVLALIIAAGSVYLYLSNTGRLERSRDEAVHAEMPELAEPVPPPATDIYIPVFNDNADDHIIDDRDPVIVLLQEAAADTGSALDSAVHVTNRGFLYDIEAEDFVRYNDENGNNIMLLYLMPSSFYEEGLYELAEDGGRRLKVFAATAQGYEIVIADGDGRTGRLLPDRFNALTSRYDNNHGEINDIDFDGHFASELMILAVGYTFSSAGYEIERLIGDDKYIYAKLRDLEYGELYIVIFEYIGYGYRVAAYFDYFECADELRVAVNAVLPDFNPMLLEMD